MQLPRTFYQQRRLLSFLLKIKTTTKQKRGTKTKREMKIKDGLRESRGNMGKFQGVDGFSSEAL